MSQDDRRDESNRWLDSQYDRVAEETRRQQRRDADYKAIADKRPSMLYWNAGMNPPAEYRSSSDATFDRILRDHRQLLRDANDDIRWWTKIESLRLSDRSTCPAQLASLCSEAEREGSCLLPALTRLKWAYEEYITDDDLATDPAVAIAPGPVHKKVWPRADGCCCSRREYLRSVSRAKK